MSDNTARYDIPCVRTGDTWQGMTLVFNQDITGWKFRMWVVKPNATQPSLVFTTEGDSPNITVTDGPGGEVVWAETDITLAPAIYKFDIEVEKPDGKVKTYIAGQWTIENDITKAA
jgi:hypothetical protein